MSEAESFYRSLVDDARHALCSALGYVLFMPLALLTHAIWSFYGMLAYPLALLGCDAKTIKEPYVLIVGPMYVSSKFWANWNYYGCEPESADDSRVLKIDRTFATRWSQTMQENLRGNETKRPAADVRIIRKR